MFLISKIIQLWWTVFIFGDFFLIRCLFKAKQTANLVLPLGAQEERYKVLISLAFVGKVGRPPTQQP